MLPILFFLSGCEGTSPQNSIPSQGIIEVDHNDIDVEDIPILGGKKEVDFVFWNNGTEPVTLLEGATSCMCTEGVVKKKGQVISPRITMAGHGTPEKINQTLAPGEEATLTAIFDPLAHGPNATGPVMREIILKTNSTQTPEISFRFLGNVVK